MFVVDNNSIVGADRVLELNSVRDESVPISNIVADGTVPN